MTVKALSRMLGEAERQTTGGVSVTFFAVMYPDSVVAKMQGYVTYGLQARVRPFKTEEGLVKILFALAGGDR